MKCRKCEHFEWEDEIPDCVFGINDIEDIDDFYPAPVHEKNNRCMLPTIEFQVKFNGPYNNFDLESTLENINWLCPENMRLILRKACDNTGFEVKYSKRFEKRLNHLRKKSKEEL
ncbi:MAG: hypothetical protein OEL89_04410 [Candidatus Peregrinibacteria bacterium]|nr:hypothetical protein [Candidatus Peregrinibacteria bacterium]